MWKMREEKSKRSKKRQKIKRRQTGEEKKEFK